MQRTFQMDDGKQHSMIHAMLNRFTIQTPRNSIFLYKPHGTPSNSLALLYLLDIPDSFHHKQWTVRFCRLKKPNVHFKQDEHNKKKKTKALL
jgi:hypothetical protein